MTNKPIKVLLVDDYEDILIEYKDILGHFGYEVFTAKEAREALDIAQTHKPHICLVDVALLHSFSYAALIQEKGLELIRKIKEISP